MFVHAAIRFKASISPDQDHAKDTIESSLAVGTMYHVFQRGPLQGLDIS